MEIIPAILTNNPEEVKIKASLLEGVLPRFQLDIIDGEFANNKSTGLETLSLLETSLLIDVHLMTKEPIDWVEKCVRAQADRIIGQIELMSDQIEFVGKVQETGSKIGLALDLYTPIEKIDETIIKDLDVILLMSVQAGFGGQSFQEKVLEKIERLNLIRQGDQTPFRICVDGGINPDSIKKVKGSGADEVVVGSSLFTGDMTQNLIKLKEGAE